MQLGGQEYFPDKYNRKGGFVGKILLFPFLLPYNYITSRAFNRS